MSLAPTEPAATTTRRATPRHYLMCEPVHYTVSYEINPWMDVTRHTDRDLAVAQWHVLRETFLALGHTVETIDPIVGLPDMVYAANGATVVDGVVYSAKFRYAQRGPEGPAYQKWFADRGYLTHTAAVTNEGEGDLLTIGDVILAGTGFRTDRAAHAEAQELFGRPVISLDLVDPNFYHLDTALAVLDDTNIAYLPSAFDEESLAILRERYPDAIIVTEEDAAILGLNSYSDGYNVVIAARAKDFERQLRERGYNPIGVDLSELLLGGGGVKCCTLELRR